MTSDMGSNGAIGVVIVARDVALREALARVIQAEPDLRCLGRYANAAQARLEVRRRKPRVILFDPAPLADGRGRHPQPSDGGSNSASCRAGASPSRADAVGPAGASQRAVPCPGAEQVRALKVAAGGSRVVVVAPGADGARVWQCLRAGAVGCCVGGDGIGFVAEAVRSVVRNGWYLCPRAGAALIAAAQGGGSSEPSLATLTLEELEVLACLVTHREKEVASELKLSADAVHGHVKAIYRKLGVTSRQEAVRVFLALESSGDQPDAHGDATPTAC